MGLLDHESFCFDSLQKQLFWFDDFEGDQLKDEWYQEGSPGATMLDGVSGGVRLTTHTDDWDYCQLYWNNGITIASLSVSKNVAIESRSALKRVTYNESYFNSLIGDSQALIMMYESDMVGATSTYICYSRDGSGTAAFGSGVSATTNYFVSRIQTATQGGDHIHFYLNGAEASNTISTHISTQYFSPMHACAFLAGGPDAMHLDVDYSAVRQDR